LLLADSEESPQTVLDDLARAGLPVWIVSPRTVRQSIADLRDLVLMYASEQTLQTVVWLDRSVDWLEGSRSDSGVRVFCPRSQSGTEESPAGWKTFAGNSYPEDLISLCGGENVFSGKSDSRYPSVTIEEVNAAAPEVILLPGDPFPFSQKDVEAIQAVLPDVPAVQNGRVLLVEGRSIFWPGWRLGSAIQKLPELLRFER
jgi:ABC-type Fe3+-hydroxamate transport system substrate-binding protein